MWLFRAGECRVRAFTPVGIGGTPRAAIKPLASAAEYRNPVAVVRASLIARGPAEKTETGSIALRTDPDQRPGRAADGG